MAVGGSIAMKKSVSTVIRPLPFPCPGIVTDYPVILGHVKYLLDNLRPGRDPCRRLTPPDIILLPRDGMPERGHRPGTFQEAVIQLFHLLYLPVPELLKCKLKHSLQANIKGCHMKHTYIIYQK